MKLLLTGKDGMLAKALQKNLPRDWTVFPFNKEQLNITDPVQVRNTIDRIRPDIIINTAAFTRVDDCETQKEIAFGINGVAVGTLAEMARSVHALLVHFSSDYIFSGNKGRPYLEDDTPNPLSVYGMSKWDGEKRIVASGCRFLVIRTQWLYGEGRNFIRTIRTMAMNRQEIHVVNDQIGSPTYTDDLACATFAVLAQGGEGIFHLTNSGTCSWFDLAKTIIALSGLSTTVYPCATEAFPRPAPRPRYSALSCEKVERLYRCRLRLWNEAVQSYLMDEKSVRSRS